MTDPKYSDREAKMTELKDPDSEHKKDIIVFSAPHWHMPHTDRQKFRWFEY